MDIDDKLDFRGTFIGFLYKGVASLHKKNGDYHLAKVEDFYVIGERDFEELKRLSLGSIIDVRKYKSVDFVKLHEFAMYKLEVGGVLVGIPTEILYVPIDEKKITDEDKDLIDDLGKIKFGL